MTLNEYALKHIERHLNRFGAHARAVAGDPNSDAIHDLRVSTRRLAQALRIFRDALPPDAPKEIRSKMSAVRQEAGAIRDGDVMMEIFLKFGLQRTHRLFRELSANRIEEEQKLKTNLQGLLEGDILAHWRHAIGQPVDQEKDVLTYAREHLSRQTKKYFAEGRKLVSKVRAPSELHEFRISTKRFRYTLEMFAELYGPALKLRLDKLRNVQETLGNLNDRIVASAMLQRFDPNHRLLPRLAAYAVAYESAFRYYWNTSLNAKGEPVRWHRYFSHWGKSPESKPEPRQS